MKQDQVIVVDYGMGNLASIHRKLTRLGANVSVSHNPVEISNAQKIILPGVGHFGKAMDEIKKRALVQPLNEAVQEKQIPTLGICLGMQLMANSSEEGQSEGFGWIDAEVKRFVMQDTVKYKVPHVGWNSVSIEKESPLMEGIGADTSFYFVHSFYMEAHNPADILNQTTYAGKFTSAVAKENIFGTQYHPEKSHQSGDQLLLNFIRL